MIILLVVIMINNILIVITIKIIVIIIRTLTKRRDLQIDLIFETKRFSTTSTPPPE